MESEMMRLDTLLDYTIKHNSEHADGLKSLARKAKELGKITVYDELMRGIEQMSRANKALEIALNRLREGSR